MDLICCEEFQLCIQGFFQVKYGFDFVVKSLSYVSKEFFKTVQVA